MKEKLENIAKADGRYNPKAFRFVYEGLTYTTKNIVVQPHHISGQMLCEGLKRLATEKWGRLAMLVLENWNVHTTQDFGEIVYLMIENKWMSDQPNDSIEDFYNVFDFKTTFKDKFKF